MDRWASKPISCQGGLVINIDSLLQGTQFPGTARTLQNFEPDLNGGYRRIDGFLKYDDVVVPGTTNNPVTGVKVAMSGVFATRKTTNDNRIYFSSGSGWTQVSTTARNGAVTKARFTSYSLVAPVVIQCDGINPAWKWDGSSETTLNSSGAPADPKYARLFKGRLALAGHSTGDLLILSAPNDDELYTGGGGALEFNVGDTIKGLAPFRDNLVIFCERSIKRLVGSTSSDFAIEPVVESIGCVCGDTIQELSGDLIYLSTDGVRSYAATERIGDVELGIVSQSVSPLVAGILAEGFDEDEYSSCCVRKKDQYRLFINNSSLDSSDNFNLLGRFQDSPVTKAGQFEWATLLGFKPYCADSEYSGNLEIAVFGHTTNGYVYRLESGTSFDGANIEAIYRTPDMTFDDATLRKVFQKIDIYTQVEGDIEASVQLILDKENTNIIQPSPQIISQMGVTPVYGTAVYDTDIYGAFVFPNFKRNLIGSGFFGTFLFYSNSNSASFRIDSFQVTFGLKGRR